MSRDREARLIERLRKCADDPMWDAHAEVSKALLREVIVGLEKLAAQLEQLRAEVEKLK